MVSVADVTATLRLLHPDGPIELRMLGSGLTTYERFDACEPAAAWAVALDARAKGIYTPLNPFDPVRIRASTVDDQAVTERRWLLVDVDPVRPKDSNSTKAELALAASTAACVESYLCERGWPLPVRALSGNGAHLLYRIQLPNDDVAKTTLRRVLAYLAEEFGTPGASVDTAVFNAARITKLYGTTARKGAHTHERPQRQSRITRIPEPLEVVPSALLTELAALAPQEADGQPRSTKAGGAQYDLGGILNRLAVSRTFVKDSATWYVVRCPWHHEHSSAADDEASVLVVGGDGGLGYKCLHEHCSSRGWRELRDHLGIETESWKARRQEREQQRPAETDGEGHPRRFIIGDRARRGTLLESMDYYAREGRMADALSTGMSRLDGRLLGGLRREQFYVLGGESGRGKTTLLLQWAYRIAVDHRTERIGIVTPEMSEESLDTRALAMLSGYSITAYREAPRLGHQTWEETDVPQNVVASLDPRDLEAFAAEERPMVLIVDYAQQAVDYTEERRYTALAALGARCLAIAHQLKIPVVLGTQVNVTKERDFTIRETHILEHQADVVIYLDVQWEKEVDGTGAVSVKPGARLRLHKNRHGSIGHVPIVWDREHYRFSEE